MKEKIDEIKKYVDLLNEIVDYSGCSLKEAMEIMESYDCFKDYLEEDDDESCECDCDCCDCDGEEDEDNDVWDDVWDDVEDVEVVTRRVDSNTNITLPKSVLKTMPWYGKEATVKVWTEINDDMIYVSAGSDPIFDTNYWKSEHDGKYREIAATHPGTKENEQYIYFGVGKAGLEYKDEVEVSADEKNALLVITW